MTVREAKENLLYLESEIHMLDERAENYYKVLEGGKPSLDFHYDCLMLEKYDISKDKIEDLKESLNELRDNIISLEESDNNLFDEIYKKEI